jgi:hypothetical protein
MKIVLFIKSFIFLFGVLKNYNTISFFTTEIYLIIKLFINSIYMYNILK